MRLRHFCSYNSSNISTVNTRVIVAAVACYDVFLPEIPALCLSSCMGSANYGDIGPSLPHFFIACCPVALTGLVSKSICA